MVPDDILRIKDQIECKAMTHFVSDKQCFVAYLLTKLCFELSLQNMTNLRKKECLLASANTHISEQHVHLSRLSQTFPVWSYSHSQYFDSWKFITRNQQTLISVFATAGLRSPSLHMLKDNICSYNLSPPYLLKRMRCHELS